MKQPRPVRLYTVVEVWRGMAESATNFTDARAARRFVRAARQRHSAHEDDVRLFESALPLTPPWRPARRRARRGLGPPQRTRS